MSLTQDIKTTFNLKNATPKFNILDQCNWVATGLYQATVYYKIVNPIGVTVYDSTGGTATESPLTCTITQSAGIATVTATSHGYSVGDTIVVTGANQSGYNIVGTILTIPTANTFTYAVNSGTVSPATTSTHLQCMKLNFDTVSIPLQGGTSLPIQGTYTITQQVTINSTTTTQIFTYSFGYVRPIVGISQNVNCFTPAFQSVDYTTYSYLGITPTINRTHTIVATDKVNFSGTAAIETLYYPDVYNVPYVSTISSDLTYTFTDGLVVYDNVTGTKTMSVQCDINMGSINCCLNTINQAYKALVGVNDFEAMKKYDILNRAIQLKDLYLSNVSFGNTQEASTNLSDLYTITGCSPSCNCSDETNQVLPYEAQKGRGIQLLLSTDTAPQYSIDDYVNYDNGSTNQIFRVLENTNVGDNPDNASSKFKFVG